VPAVVVASLFRVREHFVGFFDAMQKPFGVELFYQRVERDAVFAVGGLAAEVRRPNLALRSVRSDLEDLVVSLLFLINHGSVPNGSG
jgi:hypothetical protein